jgi:hypothetical protein
MAFIAIRVFVSLFFTLNTLPKEPSPIYSIISKSLNFGLYEGDGTIYAFDSIGFELDEDY